MAGFLQDDNGNNSSIRVCTVVWVVGVLIAWLFVCFVNRDMAEVPPSILAIMGMFLTAKVAQKQVEK